MAIGMLVAFKQVPLEARPPFGYGCIVIGFYNLIRSHRMGGLVKRASTDVVGGFVWANAALTEVTLFFVCLGIELILFGAGFVAMR